MHSAVLSISVPSLRDGREVVLLAEQEAHDTGFGFLDAEHLLVAAVTLCSGIPRFREVLVTDGLLPDRVRVAVQAFVGAGSAAPEEQDRVVCTPAATRVLARARQIAGPAERVRPHHVVLAALDGVDDPLMGAAHEVVDALGADPRRFRRALRRAARRS